MSSHALNSDAEELTGVGSILLSFQNEEPIVPAKAQSDFPSFLLKRAEKTKHLQRNLEGEKVLKTLLDMAKVAGFDNTFKHKMKGKWINQVYETAFAADGNLNR